MTVRIVPCYICKRPIKLVNQAELSEDTVACQIRTKGYATRYYCLDCWRNELNVNRKDYYNGSEDK